jgi:hypothetical protein
MGLGSAPGKIMNGHFVGAKDGEATREQYEHGIQVIDEDKVFRYVAYSSYNSLG